MTAWWACLVRLEHAHARRRYAPVRSRRPRTCEDRRASAHGVGMAPGTVDTPDPRAPETGALGRRRIFLGRTLDGEPGRVHTIGGMLEFRVNESKPHRLGRSILLGLSIAPQSVRLRGGK